ncbi:MAG: hypothetical protein FD162_1902 [Rhodobacteraceae bacterium]|nr:MAG: hypothetical protein FD162_1902 [Paracoccaceae bacterium]
MGLRAVLIVWVAFAGLAGAETGSLGVVNKCPFPLQPAAQGETDYFFDKTYVRLGGRDLRYDIAMPAAPGKYPLLILLHGGGFVSGDKTAKFPESDLRMVAARGYVVATLNYALAGPQAGEGPQSNFPQAIKDLRCGVQYFRAADDPQLTKIDTARIGVLGTSAGGHLALLLGTAADETSFDDAACPYLGTSAEVQSVAAFYPSTRFMTIAADKWSDYGTVRKNSDFYKIFGKQPDQAEDLIAKGSPLYRVEQIEDGRTLPPMLLVNAGREVNQLLVDSVNAMEQVLIEKHLPHLKVTEPRARHGYDPFAAFPKSTCTVLNFFEKTLAN